MTVLDDLVLFSRIKEKDDQEAFDLLFKRYYSRACRFAFKILKEKELSEEVVQETFIRFWETRKSLNIKETFAPYLFSSVKNFALNSYKKKSTRLKYESEYANEKEMYHNPHVQETNVSEIFAMVNEGLALLPDKCRQIFTLARFEGLSYGEIAQYLNISEKTVENQIGIAFQKLRKHLEVVKNKTIFMMLFSF